MIRWAAAAAMLGGLMTGGALFLRPVLDVQLDTPESTALSVASALGRLLFVVALIGVHLVYGHAYGLLGRIVVWALAVVSLLTPGQPAVHVRRGRGRLAAGGGR